MRDYDFPTVGEILTGSVQETLGTTTNTVDALSVTSLIRELDRINREFIRAAHTKHDNKGWSWMVAPPHHFQTYGATALNGSVSAGASSIIVDSITGFVAGGGKLYVLTSKGVVNVITYTSAASTTVPVTASTVTFALADGAWTELLYALPSYFAKERDLLVNQTGYEYAQYRGILPSYRSYSVVDGYILLPKSIGSQEGTLIYEKKATVLSTGDDSADQLLSMNVPKDFVRYATEMLNAYIFMKKRRREDAQISMQLAEIALRDALAYDINSALGGGLSVAW